jgi:hypothetical protein
MLSFRDVNADAVRRNKRIAHVEDLMFSEGREGLAASLRMLGEVLDRSENIRMTVKWDGKPAVVCGINPDNGRFFVGTKSVFNKDVRAFHTVQEIVGGTDNPELASKLSQCLIHLPKLGIKGVLQGDLLFTPDSLTVTSEEISFTPNAIRYSVDRDTEAGRKIARAKIGIAFHTVYEGKTMGNLSVASYRFNPLSVTPDPSVWIPNISVRSIVEGDSDVEEESLHECHLMAEKVGSFLPTLISNGDLMPFLMPYINSTVMAGMSQLSARGFAKYIEAKSEKEIDKLKTDKGKEKKRIATSNIINFTETYAAHINKAFDLHRKMAAVKESVLSRIPLTEFRHHFVDGDALRPTEPEGIVVSDSDRVVKFVRRSGFSAHNRKVNG